MDGGREGREVGGDDGEKSWRERERDMKPREPPYFLTTPTISSHTHTYTHAHTHTHTPVALPLTIQKRVEELENQVKHLVAFGGIGSGAAAVVTPPSNPMFKPSLHSSDATADLRKELAGLRFDLNHLIAVQPQQSATVGSPAKSKPGSRVESRPATVRDFDDDSSGLSADSHGPGDTPPRGVAPSRKGASNTMTFKTADEDAGHNECHV